MRVRTQHLDTKRLKKNPPLTDEQPAGERDKAAHAARHADIVTFSVL